MSIEVRPVDDDGTWNGYLEHAATPTAFHHAEALEVLAEHADARLHRLAGFKGQEPVGLFPVFEVERGPVTGAFSPPPDLKIPYLGPTLVSRGEPPKRRRRDRQHHEFVDGVVDHIVDEVDPQLVHVRSPPGYDDVRPYTWRSYDADPRYTYVVDIAREESELLSSFSADARRNVTGDHRTEYELVPGTEAETREIVERTADRHAEQGEPFPIDPSFVTALTGALPEGVVRPLVCRVDGEFAAGILCLETGGTGLRWLGSGTPAVDLPANDLLDWAYCREAADRGVTAFDLAGANTRRIAEYKAKFAPELVPYFRLKNSSKPMDVAVSLYDRFR